MYIDTRFVADMLLAFIALINILVIGYYTKLAWKLGRLWLSDNHRFNGLTFSMFLERAALALIFGRNSYHLIRAIFISENEIGLSSMLLLLARTALSVLLLAVIVYQDIKMQEGE